MKLLKNSKLKSLKNSKKLTISLAIIVVFLGLSTVVLSSQVNSDKIMKGTSVSGIDLSGKTKIEALKMLEDNSKFKNLTLVYKSEKWEVPAKDVGLNIYFNELVDNAFNEKKRHGFFGNIFNALKADLGAKTDIKLEFSADGYKLRNELNVLKSKIDSQTKNATLVYEKDQVKLIPAVYGRVMDEAKTYSNVLNNIQKNIFVTQISVSESKPKVTDDDLKGMNALLGSYQTTFGGVPNRDYNIVKSTVDSSDVILKQNDIYSFNGLTGEKTVARGYKSAPVIESGKLVLGIGGGVCQTSSTIFNAALYAGMDIVSRRNHTIPSDYCDLGRDATVFDGKPGQDFAFKNPYKNPVYVRNYIDGKKMISQIFGSKEDIKNIKIVTNTIAVKQNGTKLVADPSLPLGKKVVEKPSRPTIQVVTYRQYLNSAGKVEKSEKIGLSTYPGAVGITKVGGNPGVVQNQLQPNGVAQPGQVSQPQQNTALRSNSINGINRNSTVNSVNRANRNNAVNGTNRVNRNNTVNGTNRNNAANGVNISTRNHINNGVNSNVNYNR